MSEKLWFSFHTSYTSVLVASYLQQKSIILFNSIALFVCVRLWATPSSTGDACNKGHATRGVHWFCAKPHASGMRPPNQEMETTKHATKDTRDTLLLHKARTKARASSMPMHNSCNEINNRSFISNHACSRGDNTGDTLQLHKACTKAHASSMPMHNRCNEIKNKSFFSSHACSRDDDTGDTMQ